MNGYFRNRRVWAVLNWFRIISTRRSEGVEEHHITCCRRGEKTITGLLAGSCCNPAQRDLELEVHDLEDRV